MKNTTKSSTTINNAYERALQRARKSGLRILGRGRRKSDGAPIVCVSSARESNRFYVVVIDRDCMYCDCPAGHRGVLCKHEALVQEVLLCAWRAQRSEIEAREEAALRAALVELHECHKILDAALRRPEPTAPAITQREAGALLQPPRPPRSPSKVRGFASPDVAYLDPRGVASDARREPIRGFSDTRPFSLFK